MGLRREARELALQMLYALDSNSSVGVRETLQTFREEQVEITGKVREFAEGLVQGVQAQREVIDEAIRTRSKNWSLSRMPRVDLNVMRLAAYELMFRADIPKKVSKVSRTPTELFESSAYNICRASSRASRRNPIT